MTDPFHDGERRVQERAGVRAQADRIARVISDAVEPDAEFFLLRQPMVLVGSVDPEGRVWASALCGEPGFISVEDARTVRIDAAPVAGDALAANLRAGAPVALLAIEPATRERYRVNGRLAHGGPGSVRVGVEQAYGNCPKYIQARQWSLATRQAGAAVEGETLSAPQRRWIASADTFFIATRHAEHGCDVSHRGGQPGFVRVVDDRTLEWGDYRGNNMFQTLGNLDLEPRAGLLFVDYETGSVLQMTGEATVDWSPLAAGRYAGAQRVVRFTLGAAREIPGAVRLAWTDPDYSPYNPR